MRTSENAFDSFSPTAVRLKRRAFDLLRMPWSLDQADGLQVLRYNHSRAYITHKDYFGPEADRSFNFDPATGGANRFATLFLYLSDVEAGGQTVFPRVDAATQAAALAAAPDVFTGNGGTAPAELKATLTGSGWEGNMVDDCYSTLAVRPKRARAVLFYSQKGDGDMDTQSMHGGCPVLAGTKWGANLWVWNARRHGMPPLDGKGAATSAAAAAAATEDDLKISVTFTNSGSAPLLLFW